jgi:hypothetical protein
MVASTPVNLEGRERLMEQRDTDNRVFDTRDFLSQESDTSTHDFDIINFHGLAT